MASDGNGDALSYSATGLPAGLTISASGLVTGTPTAAGANSVTVTADDGRGGTGSATFSFAGTGTGVPATTTVLTNAGTGSQTIADLAAGQTYTWTENAVAGWKLVSIQCTAQNGAAPQSTVTTDLTTGQLRVALVSAEELVCTFTNRQTDSTETPIDGSGTTLKAVPTLDAWKLMLMMLAVAAMGMAGLRSTKRD